MRTMRFLPPEKQARKARETLEVFAPLAHRLGMAGVKWELEDLAFALLHPKKYDEIVRLVATGPVPDTYLRQVIDEVNAQLDGRADRRDGRGPPQAVLLDLPEDDRQGQGLRRHPRPGGRAHPGRRRAGLLRGDGHGARAVAADAGRFKDYVAQPRFGVYQSLHTTVIGPDGKPLEVQIRTRDMHRTAEYGIAAHWRYKETRGTHTGQAVEVDEMGWMRQLLDWQREAADPGEFLESLRYDLGHPGDLRLHPKGDVVTLPSGSTPVDFAYAVHTEVGHRCIGSRVNGRLVALERSWRTVRS